MGIKKIIREFGFFKILVTIGLIAFLTYYTLNRIRIEKLLTPDKSDCVYGKALYSIRMGGARRSTVFEYNVNGNRYTSDKPEYFFKDSLVPLRYNLEDPEIVKIDNDCVQILDNSRKAKNSAD